MLVSIDLAVNVDYRIDLYLLETLKIMETYLFLTIKDKKALQKLADAKMLSISTCAGIIINNLAPLVKEMYSKYIVRGEKQVHIKVKTKPHTKDIINAMIATNSIYCYFNKPLYNGKKVNWQHKYIQSELDTTEDPNKNKNIEMRIAYRVRHETL